MLSLTSLILKLDGEFIYTIFQAFVPYFNLENPKFQRQYNENEQ